MTNSSGTTFYYVTNFRGDVIRIMDGSGNSVASYTYDPWSKVLSVSENSAVAGQPLRYASYVYDTETQLYYLQARYYDPDTARFISRDPDGGDQDNPLSQNLYAYANDDPVNNVDPDGEWAFLIGAAVNAAIYHFTTPESERSLGGYAFAAATGVIGGGAFKAVKAIRTLSKVYKVAGPSKRNGRIIAIFDKTQKAKKKGSRIFALDHHPLEKGGRKVFHRHKPNDPNHYSVFRGRKL